MNQRPPQQPLDAEERALAKALPRLQGRSAPGPDLDASVLAAAQAAVQPAGKGRRVQARWIAPASLAASVLLAVGMAWHLRPLPALDTAKPATRAGLDDAQAVRMIETAPVSQVTPMVQSKPAPASTQPAVPSREQANHATDNAQQALPRSGDRPLQMPVPFPAPVPPLPAPAAAPAPPAVLAAPSPPPVASAADAQQSQASERTMRARTTASGVSNSDDAMVRDAASAIANKATVSGTARQAAPVIHNEAEMADEAGFVDDPDEDVPPATADSPAVRDAWLQRIGQLLDQGERQEAKASLSEFRRRYPGATLPPALRALEIEP